MQMGDVNSNNWRENNAAQLATGAILGSLKTVKLISANLRGF